jgi:predicted CXXCH cytochrome family protein
MFSGPAETMCFDCHDAMQATIAKASSQHAPVEAGECASCHNPHGSSNNSLLVAPYPEAFYAPYRTENFALCFTCHKPEAMEYARTSEATEFRNGDRNLHSVHVNKADKGRVCKACHGVHGADQPRLILTAIPDFGQWQIPITYTQTETGGGCVVGCHNPKTYNRVRTVGYR